MFFKDFSSQLSQFLPLNNSLLNFLRQRLRQVEPLRKQVLLQPGQVCRQLYHVNQGFFRIYREDATGHVTVDFAGAGEFLTIIPSFFDHTPSSHGMVCEADAHIYELSYKDLLDLEELSPDFTSLSKAIITKYMLGYYQDFDFYRQANATDRYQRLCQRYPNISNLVSQKDIASYLGMAPQSLSRILREMLLGNR